MARSYPRIGRVTKHERIPKRHKKTCHCGAKATHLIEVQVNYFRGDDDVHSVCDDHKNQIPAQGDTNG